MPAPWLRRLGERGSPLHLAVVRIVFCTHLLTLFLSPVFPLLQRTRASPQPLTATLFPQFLENWCAGNLELFLSLGVIAALCGICGLFTRVALWVLLACFLVAQNYYFRTTVFHDDWLYFTFYLLVLCFSPCNHRLAADRLFGKPADAFYRWPIELMIGWLALIYFAAGFAKIFPLQKGWLWLSGATVQRFALEFHFDSPIYWFLGTTLFDYTRLWPFTVASWSTAFIELAALALVVPTRRRWAALAGLMSMHLAIMAFGIPGFPKILLLSCLLFIEPKHFQRWETQMGNRWRRSTGRGRRSGPDRR